MTESTLKGRELTLACKNDPLFPIFSMRLLLCIIGVGSPPHTALMQWLVHDPDLRQPSIVHDTPNSNYGQYTILLYERSSFISGGCFAAAVERRENNDNTTSCTMNQHLRMVVHLHGCRRTLSPWFYIYFITHLLLCHLTSLILPTNSLITFCHWRYCYYDDVCWDVDVGVGFV